MVLSANDKKLNKLVEQVNRSGNVNEILEVNKKYYEDEIKTGKAHDYLLEYYDLVKSGKIKVCKMIKQQLDNHFADLKKIDDPDFPFFFDYRETNRLMNLLQLSPNIQNNGRLKLFPFQKAILAHIVGWRFKKDYAFRWHQFYLSMARKNGKTLIATYLAMYFMFLYDRKERDIEILLSANSAEQGDKPFKEASDTVKRFINFYPNIAGASSFRFNRNEDYFDKGFFKKLPKSESNSEGSNPDFAWVEEYHESKDNEMVTSLLGGITDGLLMYASTAGVNYDYPMHELYLTCKKVLNHEKSVKNFKDIAIWCFEQDKLSEIDHPEEWVKSNPLLSYPKKFPHMLERLKSSLDQSTNELYKFYVKHLNLWYRNADFQFVRPESWDANLVDPIKIDGKQASFGIDLSFTNDLTSISWLIPTGDGKFYADSHSFIATNNATLESKSKQDNIDFEKMIELGLVTLSKKHEVVKKNGQLVQTSKSIIDYHQVYDWLIDFISSHKLQVLAIGFDKYNANELVRLLKTNRPDWTLQAVSQKAIDMNVPTNELQELILTNKMLHPKNKVLDNSIYHSNLYALNNNLHKISKTTQNEFVDPTYALLDAYIPVQSYYVDQKANDNSASVDEWLKIYG